MSEILDEKSIAALRDAGCPSSICDSHNELHDKLISMCAENEALKKKLAESNTLVTKLECRLAGWHQP